MNSNQENKNIQHDSLYKVVLIGDSGVGKSNILTRFTKNEFNPESKTTIGVEFATKNIMNQNKKVKLQVWDTAGQERYRSMASAYYRGAMGAFLIYDITRLSTFENIEKWLKELKNYSEQNLISVLIGNKSDLRQYRAVKSEQGQQYARKNKMLFFETSALDASNIQQSFKLIVQQISNKEKSKPTQSQSQSKQKPMALKHLEQQESLSSSSSKKCC